MYDSGKLVHNNPPPKTKPPIGRGVQMTMSDEELKKIEIQANENISRGYMAESVQIPSYDWAMVNDERLKLCAEIRRLRGVIEKKDEKIKEVLKGKYRVDVIRLGHEALSIGQEEKNGSRK